MAQSTRSDGTEGAQRNGKGHAPGEAARPLRSRAGCVTGAGRLAFLSLILHKRGDNRTYRAASSQHGENTHVMLAAPGPVGGKAPTCSLWSDTNPVLRRLGLPRDTEARGWQGTAPVPVRVTPQAGT